ncbi:MAG: M3 family metallopeptidase [Candidatus Nitrotoga sp.]|nr:M3 family metallopeptidase [Candidatus Nitrotoga sp.]MDW7604558.1 M3 family metallopeptidase [Candidatus Nitrotoga sp.]MDW7612635.1 M3 family metallopeptidase [Candidatus Nitrotoga sp.]MDW7625074.1 M3 family metallopeptidase [Candidatus Nitrotoga sp.]
MNPLLDFSSLPRFGDINSEHIAPALDQLLTDGRALNEQLVADKVIPTWHNFMQPLIDADERLSRLWGQISHLNSVMNSTLLREAYNTNLPKVTQYCTELAQNFVLFKKVADIHTSPEFSSLSEARQRIIENQLRDFRLGGAELEEEKKTRFMAIREELSTLCARFSDNVLDATNDFTWLVEDEKDLSGIPVDERQVAAEAAQEIGKSGWLFTLKAPSYGPLMQYADNRALRKIMYTAYITRASELSASALATDQSKPDWNNAPLIIKILKLRSEEANLLGFANFSELSLATKMADTSQQVRDFLGDLARCARPFAEKDLAELREFAFIKFNITDLQAWDIGYVSEHLRQQRYDFSEQEVKQYFPEDSVLSGMFKLAENLYDLTIRAASSPTWHETVRFYDILDANGRLAGQFYLDLYARSSKRGGAWMDSAITRRRVAAGIQTPVAYLNCNFAAPVGGRCAQFTHDEVITLFHEFGHGLHHLLTQVEDLGVSGINGVEWDAVELPSQFMENFCWEWDVLKNLTRHVDTQKKLSRTLFHKMLAAKNFQSGLQTLRQIEFALVDMRLHSDFNPNGTQTVQQLLDEVRDKTAVLAQPVFNRSINSFLHIFSGGYAAGYYSYKWAEVLSADAYSLFEEGGVFDLTPGLRFRDEILAVGGSRDAMKSFVAFRGRKPTIDALLRHSGLSVAN